jgi:hypothetical protein
MKNHNEVDEIGIEDLEVAADFYDNLIEQKTLKEKIKEQFGFTDDQFSSYCSDLYVLTSDPVVKKFAADNGFKSARFTWSDVKGQSWYAKPFLEIPFAN